MEGKSVFAALGGLVLMIGCCALPLLVAAGGVSIITAWFSDNVAVIAIGGVIVALLLVLASRRRFGRIPERRQE